MPTSTLTDDAIVDELRRRGPCPSSVIARALHASSNATLSHMRKLEQAGQVTRSGERAKTRWRVV